MKNSLQELVRRTGGRDTSSGNSVAFNIDDSGYLKGSQWLATSTDAVTGVTQTQDGFLVLDRNYNGVIDSGKELFSNGAVDLTRRGLQGMKWVDANYDGKLTNAAPVCGQAANDAVYEIRRIA